jgi:2-methylisocitrate lyase-like PEP mutase family enzyme
MTHAAQPCSLLASGRMIIAPGAFDAIIGSAIAQAGFPAAHMSPAGAVMALGYLDYGLATITQAVANANRIVNSIDIPLICDSDTGFGNELNVFRSLQEFELIGVVSIHLEDRVFPKKCGHLENKELVGHEDFVAKIRAASAARQSKDFCIIARTGAHVVLGFDEAVERADRALANGADVAFIEAPQSMEEIEAVSRRVEGPCLLNVAREEFCSLPRLRLGRSPHGVPRSREGCHRVAGTSWLP